MKHTSILICLLALALLLCACAGSPAASTQPVTTAQPTEPPVVTAAEDPEAWKAIGSFGKVGTVLPDFSAKTADGGVFTLSEALKDHELVLINLWATWCPPCNMEFPFLQKAYEEAGDRVAVVALSVEEGDTLSIIQKTAEEKGLSFPMGRDENERLAIAFRVNAIPTSILVDREQKVVWMDSGAMSSAQEFLDLFSAHLPGEQSAQGVSYSVTLVDQEGKGVPGCIVGFCTDTECAQVVSDAEGVALFRGEPYAYHVQILSLPDGYEYNGADNMVLMSQGDALTVTLDPAVE
ncbi:MAG: redoxin domain-containing protein [Oscillospiraceae bacterium]|nr:redoxin domain-containing protein [Oscillospiraceae bacterium]